MHKARKEGLTMNEIDTILDYFIKYEVDNRLNNVELRGKDCINIEINDLEKIDKISSEIFKKKTKLIQRIIHKTKWKQKDKQLELQKHLKEIADKGLELEEHFDFQELVKKEDCKFEKDYINNVKEINSIIKDNRFLVLYPILSCGKRKIPLIYFEMSLSSERLVVDSYHLQIDALRIILSNIFGCEALEVELYVEDFNNFFKSLSTFYNDNIFQIIQLIESELSNKFEDNGFIGLWENKNYKNWAMTSEVVLTMECFKECLFPPYQKEIEEVKHHLKQNDSPLIRKYLFVNDNAISSDEVILNGHFGSYTDKFVINSKQTKIISAYHNNYLLAVSGPPGTGKSTVIKELIADNIVRKTKLLVDNWDKRWELVGKGKQEVYRSPLKGMCQYSMLIASGNNEAVNNIGSELLEEIPFFSDIVSCLGNIKGTLCARLGKLDNMQYFRKQLLEPFLKGLEENDYNEKNTIMHKKVFQKDYEDISRLNDRISQYISLRDKICHELRETAFFDEEINSESVDKNIKKLKNHEQFIEENMKLQNSELVDLKHKKICISDELVKISQIIINYTDQILHTQNQINKIREVSKSVFFPEYRKKILEKKYGAESDLRNNVDYLQNARNDLQAIKEEKKLEYNNIEEKIDLISNKLVSDEEMKNDVHNMIKKISKFSILMSQYKSLIRELGEDIKWDYEAYHYFNHESIVKKRFRLFQMSLKVTEDYIKKYSDNILFNLKKVYPDKWFQSFYREDFRYNEMYMISLKALWETLFLCFPVVTSTLYSLDYKKFPMIYGIFDTLFLDEAGQSIIHTAIGALYRFRKAVIVGDVFQLEPIRIHKNDVIDTVKLRDDMKEILNADKNSIQNAADRGSDVFDMMNEQKVGIVLNEHRRCENAIAQFSNRYVYGNSLVLTKENRQKPLLKNNLIMIDVRGIKEKNENISEIDICSQVVDRLLELNNKNYEKNIGIITPYKKQADVLKDTFKNIECGTVHVFQGKEKETIILSLVLDDSKIKGSLDFVGGKPNFLNVAFTRAKSQLIIIGNYEVCSKADNYLGKAIKTIKEYGKIYSIYESDIFENEKIDDYSKGQLLSLYVSKNFSHHRAFELLNKYTTEGIITGPRNHNCLLNEAFRYADKSLDIISPWIRSSVVTSDFLESMSKFKEDGKSIYICFGYNKTNYDLNEIEKIVSKDNFGKNTKKDVETIKMIYGELSDKLKYIPPIHSKVLIIDDIIMIIGSHNWLSNNGKQCQAKDEVGCVITDTNAINYIKKRYHIETV